MGRAKTPCSSLRLKTFGFLLAMKLTTGAAEEERNNWAVLVETSKYWYNYRHVSNVLSFYHTVKRLGIPDSQILLMVAEDAACNSRNARPGTVINNPDRPVNLYGEDVEVDYRGDEVSVENFLRLLTGRHPANTPRNKRLLTDSMSNIFIFISGHSGDEFIKFQDWEEITSNDIADAFSQMHQQKRYRQIFWVSDTCQASTLQNQFYSPGLLAYGSSGKKENSYSYHVDAHLGVSVVDRFTFAALEYLNRVDTSSSVTVGAFTRSFSHHFLHAHPELRTDLFGQSADETRLIDFLASTGRMRFQSSLLDLERDSDAEGKVLSGVGISSEVPGSARTKAATLQLPLLEELQRLPPLVLDSHSLGARRSNEDPLGTGMMPGGLTWLGTFAALTLGASLLL